MTSFIRLFVLVLCSTSLAAFAQDSSPSLCDRQLALIEKKLAYRKDSINSVYSSEIALERKKLKQSLRGKEKPVQIAKKKAFAEYKKDVNQSRNLALRMASVKATQEKSEISINCKSIDHDYSAEESPLATTSKESYTPINQSTYQIRQEENSIKSIEPNSVNLISESVIHEARRYLGVPYKWGGNSPKSGFDCSGFVGYVYNKFGKQLPRTTSEMANYGQRTQINRAEPGDLIFFSHKGRDIDHVGMVIRNDGEALQVIHSSTSSGVVITDVKSCSYWSSRVRKAVRVL